MCKHEAVHGSASDIYDSYSIKLSRGDFRCRAQIYGFGRGGRSLGNIFPFPSAVLTPSSIITNSSRSTADTAMIVSHFALRLSSCFLFCHYWQRTIVVWENENVEQSGDGKKEQQALIMEGKHRTRNFITS
jgi:hypothetical protein